METKPSITSKTIWFNLIAALSSFAAMQGFEITPEQQGAIATIIVAIVNIILRFISSKKVTVL